MYPVLDPTSARSGLPGAIASALTLPPAILALAGLHLCALSPLLQIVLPPIHSRLESFGSIRNGVMNRKLPAGSVIPEIALVDVAPPLSERRKESSVVSK